MPPRPGQAVRRAEGLRRDQALFFDGMERKVPIGLSRDGEPVFANLDFLDGTRGAHVNISGISGVATKTSYATFLLHSLFTSGALGGDAANTHALVFNVKGEDLLFLDQPNARLRDEDRAAYAKLGLPAERFASVQILAPVRKGSAGAPRRPPGSRGEGVTAFFWTIREVVHRAPAALPVRRGRRHGEPAQLRRGPRSRRSSPPRPRPRRASAKDAWIEVEGQRIDDVRRARRGARPTTRTGDESLAERWARPRRRRAPSPPSSGGSTRRPATSAHLIRGKDVGKRDDHCLDWKKTQVSVVDIHALHDRAKRFVVGAVLKRMFEEKEALGTARPLVFVVLDELNKYAPREGSGPIKEVLLDISERGRSLGIVLVGRAADGERGRGPDRGERGAARRRPARRGRGRAARVRLPDRGRPRPGRHPQARHDDRAAARDPDAAARALPVPGLGHAQERGGRGGRGRPVRRLP